MSKSIRKTSTADNAKMPNIRNGRVGDHEGGAIPESKRSKTNDNTGRTTITHAKRRALIQPSVAITKI